MTVDDEFRKQVELVFQPLRLKASGAFPARAALSIRLEKQVPRQPGHASVNADSTDVSLFATAAVEMWHRAVHSFLISASLTKASPIWSSVSGYYSSHYSIRALAHMGGCFQLHRQKRVVTLELKGRRPLLTYSKKGPSDREHVLYWKVVKENPQFAKDDLYTENDSSGDRTDVGHRDYANYVDHLHPYPSFIPLTDEALKERVEQISSMELTSIPIPKRTKYPDLDAVQLIAYHRLVNFRQVVDEVLGGQNRFWKVQRAPSWVKDALDFQLTPRRGPDMPGSRS